MKPIAIRHSKTMAGQFLLGGLAFVVVGTFILELRGLQTGLMVIGGYVLVLYGAWGLLDKRPQLFLDEQGISGKRLGGIEVPWDLLRAAYLRPLGRIPCVWLEWLPPGAIEVERRPVRLNSLELSADRVLDTILSTARTLGKGIREGA